MKMKPQVIEETITKVDLNKPEKPEENEVKEIINDFLGMIKVNPELKSKNLKELTQFVCFEDTNNSHGFFNFEPDTKVEEQSMIFYKLGLDKLVLKVNPNLKNLKKISLNLALK